MNFHFYGYINAVVNDVDVCTTGRYEATHGRNEANVPQEGGNNDDYITDDMHARLGTTLSDLVGEVSNRDDAGISTARDNDDIKNGDLHASISTPRGHDVHTERLTHMPDKPRKAAPIPMDEGLQNRSATITLTLLRVLSDRPRGITRRRKTGRSYGVVWFRISGVLRHRRHRDDDEMWRRAPAALSNLAKQLRRRGWELDHHRNRMANNSFKHELCKVGREGTLTFPVLRHRIVKPG
jgi:hypothetical protein